MHVIVSGLIGDSLPVIGLCTPMLIKNDGWTKLVAAVRNVVFCNKVFESKWGCTGMVTVKAREFSADSMVNLC